MQFYFPLMLFTYTCSPIPVHLYLPHLIPSNAHISSTILPRFTFAIIDLPAPIYLLHHSLLFAWSFFCLTLSYVYFTCPYYHITITLLLYRYYLATVYYYLLPHKDYSTTVYYYLPPHNYYSTTV